MMVPFERGATDGANLDPASTVGSDGSSTVACISCHRAHASAFNNAIRWDSEHELLTQSGILNELTTTILAGGAIPYYRNGDAFDPAVEYGDYQRSLCNKCHVKD
jgi:predicted CXXCH cytochrome family protein